MAIFMTKTFVDTSDHKYNRQCLDGLRYGRMLWFLKRKKDMIVRFGTYWFIASQLRSRYANYCSHSKLHFMYKYNGIFLQRNLLTILFIWLESQAGAHVSGIVLHSGQNKDTLIGHTTCMSTLTSNHERMIASYTFSIYKFEIQITLGIQMKLLQVKYS